MLLNNRAQFKNAITFSFLVTFAKLIPLIHVGVPKKEKKCKPSTHCACVVSLIDGLEIATMLSLF